MKFPNKNHIEIKGFLEGYSSEILNCFQSIDIESLQRIANLLDQTIKDGSTIFSCGNGGSSAISEHFVCDFLKGASTNTNIQPLIHSLTSNTPTLTAVANDISYDDIFSFQLKKYANENDILICVSSSGNSPNIVKSIKASKEIGMRSISFVGFDGGIAKQISDYCLHIDNQNYGIVEDLHQSLMHLLAQYIRLKNLKNFENIDSIVF